MKAKKRLGKRVSMFCSIAKQKTQGCQCFFARRAYCVGEAPENHVCPCVRPCVSVCVSGPFWIQFLSSKVKIPVLFLSKRGPKKGPSGTFGSKSEIDLGQRIIQIL